ncbi:hypothetical protein [Clostridium magnum]|uniref:Uncharacterized protein n=1 Tax=Clostridium magnum DSM 2767 TaxID=1121326 RepID=A0A161W0P0_9CLOT|nr:hypothetical protein [Clostridium magnum]KZL88690.1 hypothetical protein CLMAG_59790 [Clostridium magnum DSM 2767]SHJ64328.1 hypothetical protein SAMN02745944_06280 [Clostridium magnum DSM 2767]
MYRVMIKNILVNLWMFTDEKFETIDAAKIDVEKRVNAGQRLNDLKIMKECEDIKVKVV